MFSIGKSFAFLQIMVPMKMPVYQSLLDKKQNGKKSFAVLIDPDKVSVSSLNELIALSVDVKVDYFFVGGSLVVTDHLDAPTGGSGKACHAQWVVFRHRIFDRDDGIAIDPAQQDLRQAVAVELSLLQPKAIASAPTEFGRRDIE